MSRTARSTAPLPATLDRRLVFVTGKGGVGKSTVAAALGMISARHGRRTIVAELARRDDVSRTLATTDGTTPDEGAVFTEVELAPNLFTISIDPELAMEEYLIDQLPVRMVAERLGSSRTFSYLAAATPGLRELLAMGKAWELAQPKRRTPGARPYDLVVVDAPATGHGVAFLSAPRTFAATAAVGPVARQARTIQAMVEDPGASAVLAVARPTEASVLETLALRGQLREELGLELARVVINGVEPRRFSGAEYARLRDQEPLKGGQPLVGSALRAARHAHRRATVQQSQVARLRRHLDRPPIVLPQLFAAALGPEHVARLANRLEARL